MKVEIKKLREGAIIPQYAKPGDSGMDLCACIDGEIFIAPGGLALIGTGIAVAVPNGYEMQIRPRSGLALKNGITVLNTPGTIDSQYRGEIGVILFNAGESPFQVSHGDRIAQAVICPVAMAQLVVVDDLPTTERGTGGFGSSGV